MIMTAPAAPIVPIVVEQHLDESAVLCNVRATLVNGPAVKLHHLRRLDNRIAAHLDGLAIAGDDAWRFCEMRLENAGNSEVFVATALALETRRQDGLDRLFAIAQATPDFADGLTSAFGWVERDRLKGVVARLLASSVSFEQVAALTACAAHGVDPGMASGPWLEANDAAVRARALRAAGELGRHELVTAVAAMATGEDPDCSASASSAAVLLGNQGVALEALSQIARATGPYRARALRLAFQAMPLNVAHGQLQLLASDPKHLRWLIEGSGIAGDPAYVPWLLGHMGTDQTARLAGEAFSLVTGTDLAWLDLERKPPEDFESGPNDDPDDPNVDMDPDEGLPWPDPDRVKDWWAKNSGRFTPGQRYFMGAPVTREHCIDVLKNGYQRQRILAAHYLCLLEPGTPLFNTSAPAWRQQKLLAQMG